MIFINSALTINVAQRAVVRVSADMGINTVLLYLEYRYEISINKRYPVIT